MLQLKVLFTGVGHFNFHFVIFFTKNLQLCLLGHLNYCREENKDRGIYQPFSLLCLYIMNMDNHPELLGVGHVQIE